MLEVYYAYSVTEWVTVSPDYQFIADPGYNADRGPVSMFSLRLHAEFCSVVMARKNIKDADIVLFMVDATKGGSAILMQILRVMRTRADAR